jgi:hypothetical protein
MSQFVTVTTAVKEGPCLLPATFDGRLHTLHVRLEIRQGALVLAAQVQHVCHEFVLRIRAALIVDPGALAPPGNQTRLGKNAKMPRDAALSHTQNVDHLVDIERRSRKQAQQAQTRLIGEGFVDLQQI